MNIYIQISPIIILSYIYLDQRSDMGALECVAIALILVAIWQCCKKAKAEGFGGEPPRPYTPAIRGPAWAVRGNVGQFEGADTPNRAGTLLNRMGMDNAGESFARNSGIGRGTFWNRNMNF